MKLVYKKIDRKPENSFLARRKTIACLEEYWHYHTENELVYFLKSTGTFYIGNTINHFRPGEIFFLGSNLPHVKRSDRHYYELPNPKRIVDLILIQFNEDFLGNEFVALPESKNLQSLLHRAARGLKFPKEISSQLHGLLAGLPYENGLTSVISLLKVLERLAACETYTYICSGGVNVTFRANEKMRMSKVINYLTEHYDQKITIEEIAGVANMAPNAFCRFFRNKTQKSFTEYLNEIRIGNACKLLIEGDMQVSEISYRSGFSSLSNFNRRFKQVMGNTPTEYLKKYAGTTEMV